MVGLDAGPENDGSMRKLSSKEILLAALVVGLGVVVYLQYQKWAGSHPSQTEIAIEAVKSVNAADLPPITVVSLDRGRAVKIRSHSRNLFNYSKSPDEIADEIRRQREAEQLARDAAERRRLQQEAEAAAAAERAKQLVANPPPPEPPVIPFRFIGKMGDSRSPIAVLVDVQSSDIYTVREGEVIGDKFKVKKIEFDAVTIVYADALIAKNPDWAGQSKIIRMGS